MQNIYQIAAGPFHSLFLSREGDMFVCGSSNQGKLGIFDLNAKLLGRGQDLKTTSSYIIDRPWKLHENVPLKFYRTKEGKDIFETYNLFRKNYTSQGLLRKDVQG